MRIFRRPFGKYADETPVELFRLENNNGVFCEITNYGGVITSFHVPDRDGNMADVVLGYDTFDGYISDPFKFGAIVGRYANRIAEAAFSLNGILYPLGKNFGRHHMHGGFKGFNKAVWRAETAKTGSGEALVLSYTSVDGEEGYPGNLDVKVTYTLTGDNALVIGYLAVSDKDTIVNLTNHAYFNLSGHNSGEICDHILTINADRFVAIDGESMPTGELRSVDGSPLDFTSPVPIGLRIDEDYEQIKYGSGYDHTYALDVSGAVPVKAAECHDLKSGRTLEVLTTKPGIHLYTSNRLHNPNGKNGAVYGKRSAFCLETQYYPDSPHHPGFPSPVLRAGMEYRHTTIYRFSLKYRE